jgi:hypothetical protein
MPNYDSMQLVVMTEKQFRKQAPFNLSIRYFHYICSPIIRFNLPRYA